jgi:hypothetical protein
VGALRYSSDGVLVNVWEGLSEVRESTSLRKGGREGRREEGKVTRGSQSPRCAFFALAAAGQLVYILYTYQGIGCLSPSSAQSHGAEVRERIPGKEEDLVSRPPSIDPSHAAAFHHLSLPSSLPPFNPPSLPPATSDKHDLRHPPNSLPPPLSPSLLNLLPALPRSFLWRFSHGRPSLASKGGREGGREGGGAGGRE